MKELNNRQDERPETMPDDVDQPLTSAADVESAGRSCIVIIAMVVIILVLLGIWVLYTTT